MERNYVTVSLCIDVTLTRVTNGRVVLSLNSTTRARPDPHGLFLRRGSPRNSVGSVRVSDKVRAGPVGSGRARVVEFSLNWVSSVHSSVNVP